MTELLQTKLFKPTLRRSLVPRTHLIRKLDKGLEGKVTLVSAPAGFGKTSVVVQWLSQVQRPLGWLSLDEEDNDPHRFFTYLTAALAPIASPVEILPPAPTLSIEAMTTQLVNNLARLSEPGLLVLDDYHLIGTSAIHETMAFLCEHLPPSLHLVMISRSDPPLPLARMRARGELSEIRQVDLRFSLEESAVFLNQMMDLNLTAREIAVLEARTEGWIASLQLAALSLRDASDPAQFIDGFTGTHRYIVDYLVEEVLTQRPPGTREFLLKTSILNRFSASLCDVLLSDDTAQEQLEELEAANFFLIPLDNERRWYRYHHLFADLLRQRAAQAYPDQLPHWYRKAAHWYQANDLPYDAIEMALSGADHDRAAVLILRAAETEIWAHGEWLLLDRWLAALPESTVKSQPRLCLYHAWGSLIRGQLATCNARLADAESAIQRDPGANQLALGELSAIRAAIARFQGNQRQVISQADIALDNLPPADNPWRVLTLLNLGAAHFLDDDQAAATEVLSEVWQLAQAEGQAMWGCVSASFLAQLLVRGGRYHEAAQLYQQALSLALPQQESIFNIGMIYVGLGELWLAWNDLDKAEDFLQKGLDIGATAKNMILMLSGSLALARLRQIQGDREVAESLILQSQEVAQTSASTWSWVHVPTAAYLIRAWVKQGALPEARRLLEGAFVDAVDQSGFWLASLKIAQARVLFAEERWQDADRLLATLWEPSVSKQRIRRQIEILVLMAVAQYHLRQPEQVRIHLENALVLARPSGEIRLFVDEGRPIQEMIAALHFDDVALQAYRRTISDAFSDPATSQTEDANQQLIEPLTARELELLALVAGGSTNREIAEQLVISYGTVRRHLNNIYGKLGVNSRALAILAAQERNLV